MALLRYFNPIGAHKSGLIGEDPNGIPNNLMPYIAKVAVGKLEKVHVFGNDYPTPDGTGVRDYIHVVDLARGHVCAIKKLETNCGLFICNLGTGKGYSVLDVIHAFEKACGKPIPYVIEARRPGDIAECYADPTKARNELGWVAEYGIEEMCADSWNWQNRLLFFALFRIFEEGDMIFFQRAVQNSLVALDNAGKLAYITVVNAN